MKLLIWNIVFQKVIRKWFVFSVGTDPKLSKILKQKSTLIYRKNRLLSDYLNHYVIVTIVQSNIKIAAARRYHEDKWICKLKTLVLHGLNTEISEYAKEM